MPELTMRKNGNYAIDNCLYQKGTPLPQIFVEAKAMLDATDPTMVFFEKGFHSIPDFGSLDYTYEDRSRFLYKLTLF